MGFNTTVIVLNDALDDIERDPEFGKKLSRAIQHMSISDRPVDVTASNHCNAASVIETHHADGTVIVAIGQNTGDVVGRCYYIPYDETRKEKIVRQLADQLGFTLRKKTERRKS